MKTAFFPGQASSLHRPGAIILSTLPEPCTVTLSSYVIAVRAPCASHLARGCQWHGPGPVVGGIPYRGGGGVLCGSWDFNFLCRHVWSGVM